MYVTPGRRVWLNLKLWIQFSIYCGIKMHLDFIHWDVFYFLYKVVLSQETNSRYDLHKIFVTTRCAHNHNLHVYFSCRPGYTLALWVCCWRLMSPLWYRRVALRTLQRERERVRESERKWGGNSNLIVWCIIFFHGNYVRFGKCTLAWMFKESIENSNTR